MASFLAVAATLPAADADLGVDDAARANRCAASSASEIGFDLWMVSAVHFPPRDKKSLFGLDRRGQHRRLALLSFKSIIGIKSKISTGIANNCGMFASLKA